MTENHTLNIGQLDLERIHVVEQIPGVKACVVENRPAGVPLLHPNESGKPMFGNGLWAFKRMPFHRFALGNVGAAHGLFDAFILDDDDLDVLDRQQ